MADLYPQRTAFAPRTTVEATRWVLDDPVRIDTVTGTTLGVMGAMPLICHRAAATDSALEFMRLAGLQPPSTLLTYDTTAEAVAAAHERIALGEKLAYIYPPPNELSDTRDLLISTDLYGQLNDKGRIADFVDAAYLPPRFIIPIEELKRTQWPALGHPVFMKASLEGATGAGHDVRYAPDSTSWQSAIAWFQRSARELAGVVVEDAIDIRTCWCVGVAILGDGCRHLGSAIQTFDGPARQSGSRIDPDDVAPDLAVEIALEIANRAREAGYRGVAGFDIGIDEADQLFVFDLNFRLNASTNQLLLHEGAAERIGARISESWGAQCDSPLTEALGKLRPFVEKGVFVPTRLFDRDAYGETKDGERTASLIDGIVLADTVEGIRRVGASMKQSLGESLR